MSKPSVESLNIFNNENFWIFLATNCFLLNDQGQYNLIIVSIFCDFFAIFCQGIIFYGFEFRIINL